ncbi:MAG: DNA polymerase III subunit beta [Oligoflexia bacterium]|nr:DNA polymerase III subunit beta [Oligoflexia bacterium]
MPRRLLKIQVKRSSFFELVSQANSLIEKRVVVPILSKILISTKESKYLCVQATDQDNSLQNEIPVKVEGGGKVVIDAQTLYEILKELPEGIVELKEQEDKKVRLKQGASVFHLLSLQPRDFPAFPPFQMSDSFSISAETLKYLIDKTIYCSSLDDTRYHLTGIFFETLESIRPEKRKEAGAEGKIEDSTDEKEGGTEEEKEDKRGGSLYFRFVATDGHRLALAEYPCEKSLEKGVIISKKGVQEIKKLVSLASGEEKVEVAVKPPRILFRYGSAILSVKLVEGGYPAYQPFIPKSGSVSVEVEVDTNQFSQTLRRVSLLSSTRFKGVNFDITEKKIQMESENPDLGKAQDEVTCVRKKGGDLKVRFNARYILEALSSIGTKKAFITFGGKEKACVIYPVLKGEREKHSFCVIMPMKM